ncbi:hypothetical protein, partial [Endozoicomonas acroporae]|uniref:hypothetical protein n=1 Tax=Endozoicomonas acroporae TaxID=1701104 RepID=UPI003D7AF20E
DLVNGDVSSLDQIRWHFEGKALGKKVFTDEDRQQLLAELKKLDTSSIDFNKFEKISDREVLFNKLTANFDDIFKII